uniref:Uncharacterized protein n=1 Tax=Leersia perrieri TaxID=77586 RepID=A0A0D9WP14_9ORYZ
MEGWRRRTRRPRWRSAKSGRTPWKSNFYGIVTHDMSFSNIKTMLELMIKKLVSSMAISSLSNISVMVEAITKDVFYLVNPKMLQEQEPYDLYGEVEDLDT